MCLITVVLVTMKLLTIVSLALILSISLNTEATLLPLLHTLGLPNLLPAIGDLLHPNQAPTTLSCQADQSLAFRNALNDFSLNLYTSLSDRANDHFVTSPFSIWLDLAALSEGAGPEAQAQLFKILGLPQEYCLRQKFYTIALSLETPGVDVSLLRNRGIIFDKAVQVDRKWSNFAKSSKLLDYAFAPIRENPVSAEDNLRRAIGSRRDMPMQGNSVIIDSLKYRGLWTYSFDEENIRNEAFYDEEGNQIGTVPMMRIKLRVRIAEILPLKAKVVELPVGDNGRYSMLIGLGMENTGMMRKLADLQHGAILSRVLNLLHYTLHPIIVGIPQFAMTSDYDATKFLEKLGITDIWNIPDATRYVSNPPALPGGLIQKVSVKLEPKGISPPPEDNIINVLGELVTTITGHDFIANKPFMYALIDRNTQNVLFAGSYSDPNNI